LIDGEEATRFADLGHLRVRCDVRVTRKECSDSARDARHGGLEGVRAVIESISRAPSVPSTTRSHPRRSAAHHLERCSIVLSTVGESAAEGWLSPAGACATLRRHGLAENLRPSSGPRCELSGVTTTAVSGQGHTRALVQHEWCSPDAAAPFRPLGDDAAPATWLFKHRPGCRQQPL
jgi:hypothetical protein